MQSIRAQLREIGVFDQAHSRSIHTGKHGLYWDGAKLGQADAFEALRLIELVRGDGLTPSAAAYELGLRL